MPNPAAIVNPKGAYGLPIGTVDGATPMTNDQFCYEMVNASNTTLRYGDVVIFATGTNVTDPSGLNAGLTAAANDVLVAGVVAQIGNPIGGVPPGAAMLVQFRGVARVNVVNTSAIVAGTPIATNGTVKQATGNAAAITVANAGSILGYALEAFAAGVVRSDGATTIRVKLCVGA